MLHTRGTARADIIQKAMWYCPINSYMFKHWLPPFTKWRHIVSVHARYCTANNIYWQHYTHNYTAHVIRQSLKICQNRYTIYCLTARHIRSAMDNWNKTENISVWVNWPRHIVTVYLFVPLTMTRRFVLTASWFSLILREKLWILTRMCCLVKQSIMFKKAVNISDMTDRPARFYKTISFGDHSWKENSSLSWSSLMLHTTVFRWNYTWNLVTWTSRINFQNRPQTADITILLYKVKECNITAYDATVKWTNNKAKQMIHCTRYRDYQAL